ncbi:DUF2834 domain-containing protein [Frigidibacter sp. MR17.24]|uniref:DUF2834 domain-containing protein n=1 Tax=Frigidibacter sp. MR17.24 TaxID=3127345 RepID=UPI003012AB9A
MSALRLCYLALTLAGLVIVSRTGLPGWPSAEGAVALAAFTLWSAAETWVRRNWPALAAIVAGWALGLVVGLPLYLFLRTRPVR